MNKSLLSRLKFQHQPLIGYLSEMDRVLLRQKPDSGKWSIFENIAHLARYQLIFIYRLGEIERSRTPEIPRYAAAEDEEFKKWLEKSSDELAEDIKVDRKYIFDSITGLSLEDLKRSGKHPKLGLMTVIEWTEFFLLHESHHLYTIFWLERKLKTDH